MFGNEASTSEGLGIFVERNFLAKEGAPATCTLLDLFE